MFVAFCLVAIWIVMSSIVPIQNSVMQVSETINEGKHIASEKGSRKFEDNLGDISEESTRVDRQTQNSQGAQKGV